MPDEIVRSYLFDRPGHYQIRVTGVLSKSWLDHLEGFEISTTFWERYPEVIQINGWLADQTALAGLLDLLTDLGLVILTVERHELDKEVKP
jgi:hypothetical protein